MVRSRVLAWQLRLTALVGVASGVVAGCGDPVLPSDYVGPPASTTTGKVVALGTVTAREVSRPRLSLEWLTSLSGTQGQSALEGQPLRFSRSPTLQTDWDIGLEVPISSPKLIDQSVTGTDGLQISVGKMVYYDDRNADGRLDWTCRSGTCDVAKAVSHEYVVYVGGTKACRNSTGGFDQHPPRRRLQLLRGPGRHHPQAGQRRVRPLPAGRPVAPTRPQRRAPAVRHPVADVVAVPRRAVRRLLS